MSKGQRWAIRLGATVVLTAMALASVEHARGELTRQAQEQLATATDKEATEAGAALSRQIEELEERAVLVANKPGIVELVRQTNSHSDRQQLAATIADFYDDEVWFAKPVNGLAVAFLIGDRLIFSSSPDLGEKLSGFLAQRPGAGGGGIIPSKPPLLVGFARIPGSNQQQEEGFFAVAQPLTSADLQSLSVSAKGLQLEAGDEIVLSGTLESNASKKNIDGALLSLSLDETASRARVAEQVRALRWQRLALAGAIIALLWLVLWATSRAKPALTPAPQAEALASTQASAPTSRYQVVAALGEGGMAQVSLAMVHGAEGFKRLFVLKRLRAEHQANEQLINQFIDEARLGSTLVHSNIVPIFDFGRDATGYYLAQEYILGRDVETLVRTSAERFQRALSAPLVGLIGSEVLKALAYAHSKTADDGSLMQLVHRDVSPANVMVSARGEVKLLDFGIVKSSGRLSQTQAGMVKGNLFYMSPEQARALDVDQRSDLFSLAMVMATALLGAPLYDGETMYELMQRAAHGPTPADLEKLAAVSGPLWPVLKRALSVDRSARFADATDMGAALSEALALASSAQLQELVATLVGDALAREQQQLAPQ